MDSGQIALGCAAALLLAATVFFFLGRLRVARTFRRMEEMLEEAIQGTFIETAYDESRMSALEVKMSRYLKGQEGREQRLKKEQDGIHALLSDISHQTKTPIANLLLYSQLLQERAADPESEELLKELVRQAEKLRFLTDSLFKASRLEHGMIALSPTFSLVSELLEAVAAQGKGKAVRRGIQIRWRVQESEDRAFFDQKWTAEAIYNILDNAIKYTCEGDVIEMEGRFYEFFYQVAIMDHGPGIAEEEIPKIFQRFYRSPTVPDGEGAGLGLYLAREIIQAQGGYLKVSSDAATTFSVFLPKSAGGGNLSEMLDFGKKLERTL